LKAPALKHVTSGFEIAGLARHSLESRRLIAAYLGDDTASPKDRDDAFSFTKDFYMRHRKGRRFGGVISPGDAIFLASVIDNIRPDKIVEIGVASGYSSAFLLSAIAAFGGACPDGRSSPRLISFDVGDHEDIGAFLLEAEPGLASSWKLFSGCTSFDLADCLEELGQYVGKTIYFVDAAHWHPWPTLDVYHILQVARPQEWILLQDVALFERKLVDALRRGKPARAGFRGVQLLYEHWQGEKFRGTGACYNMAAIRVPEEPERALSGLRALAPYAYEKDFAAADAKSLRRPQALRALSTLGFRRPGVIEA